jgi:membrane protease YdiL (CAAX protease family)
MSEDSAESRSGGAAGLQESGRGRGMVLLTVLCEGGLGALAWLLSRWWHIPLLESLTWKPGDLLLGALASGPLLGLFFVCMRWQAGPLKGIVEFSHEVIGPLFRPCRWYELAGIAALAGVGEEMLFRGVFQVALARWLGEATALLVVSLLFGLLHWITPTYAFIAGLMGLYLGLLWLGTGNLATPILTHGLYDFVALAYLVRASCPDREPTS